MACSDNVVRAGLTPKFKDVENLLRMLNYSGTSANDILFKPSQFDPSHKYTLLFKPPIDDFAVAKIEIPTGESDYEIVNSEFGSIVLVISGTASMSAGGMESLTLKRGSIIFLPSTVGPSVSLSNIQNNFICYQAMYNNF
jgi:mannose-6-phosphate isomerase